MRTRTRIVWVCAILLVFCIASSVLVVANLWAEEPIEYVKGHLIVKFVPELSSVLQKAEASETTTLGIPSLDELNKLYGLIRFEKSYRGSHPLGIGLYILHFPEDVDIFELAKVYSQNEYVLHACPNRIYHTGIEHTTWGSIKSKRKEGNSHE